MRIISQDGTIDVPYDRIAVILAKSDIHIICGGKPTCIANYSTPEKAKLALDRMHMIYQKCMAQIEKSGLMHYQEFPKVYVFPADEEV